MRLAGVKSRIPMIGGPSPVDPQFRDPRSPLARAMRGEITRSDWRRMITDLNNHTRPFSLVKPGRRLGGGWMDEFVSAGKSVSLCLECQKKYGNWNEKHGYEMRDQIELTDCDGCGEELKFCRGYYLRLRPN